MPQRDVIGQVALIAEHIGPLGTGQAQMLAQALLDAPASRVLALVEVAIKRTADTGGSAAAYLHRCLRNGAHLEPTRAEVAAQKREARAARPEGPFMRALRERREAEAARALTTTTT